MENICAENLRFSPFSLISLPQEPPCNSFKWYTGYHLKPSQAGVSRYTEGMKVGIKIPH